VVAEPADTEVKAETKAIAGLEREESEARNTSVLSSDLFHVLVVGEMSCKVI
jgi:hypothetical protein